MKKICGAAPLILDDFLLHTITDEREVKVLFEILEKRCKINLSTIIYSQREPSSWSAMILNDEVSANAIMKRAARHYTVVIKTKISGCTPGHWYGSRWPSQNALILTIQFKKV